jgi:Transposase DDE domain
VMQRLSKVQLEGEKVDIPLLNRFSAVIVEDSTSIKLPTELAKIWLGCGGGEGTSEAGVKAFVQWDVTQGKLFGPRLSDARMNDHKTPFEIEELPEGSLYLADLGFFGIERFFQIAKGKPGKRYFVTRLQPNTNVYNRRGHRIELDYRSRWEKFVK